VRVVLDTNVIVSAAISRHGSPALIVRAWIDGEFELIDSERLLSETRRSLAYSKVAKRVDADEASELIEVLERNATISADPTDSPRVASRDAADNYLIALAQATSALLVSGDTDLLDLSDRIPVMSPRQFVEHLQQTK
jgi:putative PIN family toxin of toxin-antitoxin system